MLLPEHRLPMKERKSPCKRYVLHLVPFATATGMTISTAGPQCNQSQLSLRPCKGYSFKSYLAFKKHKKQLTPSTHVAQDFRAQILRHEKPTETKQRACRCAVWRGYVVTDIMFVQQVGHPAPYAVYIFGSDLPSVVMSWVNLALLLMSMGRGATLGISEVARDP